MERGGKLTWRQMIFQFCLAAISLYIATAAISSINVETYYSIILAIGLIQLAQWLLKPFFGLVTKLLGIAGILLISLFGNAVIVWGVFVLLPGITVESFWGGFFAAWIYALLITLFNWILVSQSEDVFFSTIMRSCGAPKTPKKQGYLFVQLDGVSAPVLDWQLKAGNLPNIAKLIRQEHYAFRTWHTQIPSTTPASQAGILFGNNSDIPAFRWYEKELGELVVANQTKGARLIEDRLSNGKGLLVDGGVSIGNLFSGDAPHNIMVMSRIQGDHESIKSMQAYSSYFYLPHNFMRSFVLSLGEMLKEIYQARRQVSLDVTPRIKRHGSYVLLRAITNVLMRDLQTTIVIRNMFAGVNSIYVDYLDYDEVSHHAGIARAESLASLAGLDKVIGLIHRANRLLPQPYKLIIVSDHGQSQGTTFKQLHNGKTLEQFIAELIDPGSTISKPTAPIEEQSTARALLSQQTLKQNKLSPVKRIQHRYEKSFAEDTKPTDIVVTGSGNLGNIWLNSLPGRATLEELQSNYPNLIAGLLEIRGIGFVLCMSADGPLCIAKNGQTNLKTGGSAGDDPLASYPDYIRSALLKLTSMKNAPDIAIISEYSQQTGEVYAFEELVGNHGGIGGWQTEAILLHPQNLSIPKTFEKDGEIHDATTIFKVFKHWLKADGHHE